jgi:hypothetical protein
LNENNLETKHKNYIIRVIKIYPLIQSKWKLLKKLLRRKLLKNERNEMLNGMQMKLIAQK